MDACYNAKERGADIVKQWDSTLDYRTRKSHRHVDGEIRELDQYFSNGLRFPSDPWGRAAEVINCRCALLQRARSALDAAELEELKERAAFFGLDKSDSFDDFKQKYLKAAETESQRATMKFTETISPGVLTNSGKSGRMISGAMFGAYNNENDPDGAKREQHAKTYYSSLRNSNKAAIVAAIAKNAGVDAESVSKMYDHLIINEYDLGDGIKHFDPDYDISESIRRLREGKNIQLHDRILIGHEALEYDLMNRDGLNYEEAHSIANESYNYKAALDEWLDKLKG